MSKTYRVGGAVRDALLGLPVQDIDYVVVGATPEKMIAAGYTPVGKDFPVFLHPATKSEYALARTERKSAPGYHGFVFHCSPDVTLEQDLQRRDLTINAMAVADDADQDQTIVDPYGGQRDLTARVLRHVSDAFAEDPVRILRVARFAARFHTFSVAPETMQLMRAMVNAGEANALVPERVWQEIARGMMEQHPARMFDVLHESAALAQIAPELELQYSDHFLQVADFSAQQLQPLTVRWSALCATLSTEAIQHMAERLKLPADVRDVSMISTRELKEIKSAESLTAELVMRLLERCDAVRRPDRFAEILQAVRCAELSEIANFPQQNLLERALSAALSVPGGEIARQVAAEFPKQPQRIAEQIFAARVAAIHKLIAPD